MTGHPPRQRNSSDFANPDLSVRVASAISQRFGGLVTSYSTDGLRSAITMTIPSRRELFQQSIKRTGAALETAAALRVQTSRILDTTGAQRRRNHELRRSLTELRHAMHKASLEARQLTGTEVPGPARLPRP